MYKYPQAAFPYARLVEENRRRGLAQPEFELMEGGAFDEDRYFDAFAEYAKASPNGVLIRITIANRGPQREWKKPWGAGSGGVTSRPTGMRSWGYQRVRRRRAGCLPGPPTGFGASR